MGNLHSRVHPRQKQHDYSSNGAYFITFCVKDKHEILCELVGRDAPGAPLMVLSENGILLRNEIMETPSHYHGVSIDNFAIMPNHVHLIININRESGAPSASRPTNALIPTIMAMLKKKTNKAAGFDLWQDGYYDIIISSKEEYRQISKYIDENPIKWTEDEFNVNRTAMKCEVVV